MKTLYMTAIVVLICSLPVETDKYLGNPGANKVDATSNPGLSEAVKSHNTMGLHMKRALG